MNQANLIKINGVYVYEFNDGLYFTQTQLADILELSRTTISPRIKTLVKSGHLREELIERAFIYDSDGGKHSVLLYPIFVLFDISARMSPQGEVQGLHPLVEEFLKSINWEYDHHLPAPEQGILDFLATDHNGDKYIIECKRDANEIDKAVRQVKDYGKQYNFLDEHLYLIIALPKEETSPQLEQYLQDAGVLLWGIEGYKMPFNMGLHGIRVFEQLIGMSATKAASLHMAGVLRHSQPVENWE